MKERHVISKASMVRAICICGELAYVPLTRGYEAIIDAVDVALVRQHNWHAKVESRTVYAETNIKNSCGAYRTLKLHRVFFDAPNGMQVDHISGDGLDNRRANLRLVSISQNQHNSRISSANTSGFKGVSWHKQKNKWQALICVNRKQISLGVYQTAELAHAAYCEASKKYHKEFGRTK